MFHLQSLVDQWRSSNPAGNKATLLALKILTESEKFFQEVSYGKVSREFWLQFLDTTKKTSFLNALSTSENRDRWAEVVFRILQKYNYSLKDLIEQGVANHPDQVLFRDLSQANPVNWTYEQIYRHIREIATVFYQSADTCPRVAIFADNCLEGACTDLACLSYGIFDTPLSIHFNQEVLLSIFNTLKINIVVTDSKERLTTLQSLLQRTEIPFRIFTISNGITASKGISYLPEECKKLVNSEMDHLLEILPVKNTNEVATTMFTSGSTGLPKGVSFSIYNIVSKRFARGAALPDAGNEMFLCYLPLFHTFGRYLEMTGTIYWDGTYVFAGNSSAETLLALFPKVNPTGFISIPLRWQELYEACQAKINHVESPELRLKTVREIVGDRLSWGLSAAGYLDPRVFQFFNSYGIHLCSGFGMTEATGGITMTPPGKYRESTVGIPLPGVKTRLAENSELQLSGHYIGRYLEDAGPQDVIAYPCSGETDYWMSTGDVFTVDKDGFYNIIDRVKDIYKNNRGQTVAPQVIEKKFYKVPGIKHTFLVGDALPYNVLLITPDREDPIFKSISGDNLTEYFHQIVMAANADAAPYERVINFTLLERDFSSELGELTPKGSFNRKIIETSFREVIEKLYISNIVTLTGNDTAIQIPRWFFRDLGILETDIIYKDQKLFNRRSLKYLTVIKAGDDFYQIGNLKYKVTSADVDLGLFTRQPKLWIGNPEMIAFCPVKEGWDVLHHSISENVYRIHEQDFSEAGFPRLKSKNPDLIRVNNLICISLFSGREEAIKATNELGQIISEVEPRLAQVMRHRLEALAYHPEEALRTLAYRLILLKAPDPEQIPYMPFFIESGLSFLDEDSIREIASSNFGKHRLDALKQRLYWYRTHLSWPAEEQNQKQFETVLRMLFNFAVMHLEYYVSVRAELSRWILHKKDPFLSKRAEEYFFKLAEIFEKSIEQRLPKHSVEEWQSKMMFEYGLQEREKEKILHIFQSTNFLQESIILAFNEQDFSLNDVPSGGVWVLRLQAFKDFRHYRLSINTASGKHFDLHIVMAESPYFKPKPDTFYWLASLAGFPYGPAVGPHLGSSRPNFGILSTQYIGGLTAWDKIREFSEIHKSAGYLRANSWKKVFTKAFTVIFRAWHNSGFQIVPGIISPANVAVPEMDFRESAVLLSLTGWTTYKNTISLIGPIVQDFYCKTASLYPWCKGQLDVSWVFDACIEALGKEEASEFLKTLHHDLQEKPMTYFDNGNLLDDLDKYMKINMGRCYLPLALYSAIDQYGEWYRMNPLTTGDAKEQTIFELLELYKLHGYPELIRYHFYRHSYFNDADVKILSAFDKLLEKMQKDQEILPIQLLELSELQSVIIDPEDKDKFSRMVFPRLQFAHQVDLVKVGENLKEHVVVKFNLTDKSGAPYIQREPGEPREIGQLYQLFFRENYPKEISDADHHYVVTDSNEKIIGGLTWRQLENKNVLLDGIVVTSSLQGRGIASGMIENFFTSMAVRGVKIVKAHFLFGNYYLKHYFEVDKKWGALIKTLNENDSFGSGHSE